MTLVLAAFMYISEHGINLTPNIPFQKMKDTLLILVVVKIHLNRQLVME